MINYGIEVNMESNKNEDIIGTIIGLLVLVFMGWLFFRLCSFMLKFVIFPIICLVLLCFVLCYFMDFFIIFLLSLIFDWLPILLFIIFIVVLIF